MLCPWLLCCAAFFHVVLRCCALGCFVWLCLLPACCVPPLGTVCWPGVFCIPALCCAVFLCAVCSAQCVFCPRVLVPAVVSRCSLYSVRPRLSCCMFPVSSALCGAVLRCAGAFASCCSFGLCCFWCLVVWCVAVCCAFSCGVLRCSVTLRCWLCGVLCCRTLCRVLWRPIVLCRGASCVMLCCAVLVRLQRAPLLCSVDSVALGGVLWCCLWFLSVRRRALLPVAVSWRRVASLVSLACLVGALLLVKVCCGALLPCALSCSAVRLCGAVMLCPAVFFSVLFVFVCSGLLQKPLQNPVFEKKKAFWCSLPCVK